MTPDSMPAAATALWVGLLLGRWLGRRRESRRLYSKERLDGCRGPHEVRGESFYLVPEGYYRELTNF